MLMLGTVIYLTILKFNIISGNDSVESTLTTASTRASTSPKPTTIYRRIFVQEENLSTPDLYKSIIARRKKTNSLINNWDTWCQFQPKVGNCLKFEQRYYYDLQLNQCKLFNYSGCNGNKNMFEMLTDCEQLCEGVISLSTFTQEKNYKNICQLQPHTGMCLAMINKYYYDINDKKCKKFVYGGCGGNLNKFDTLFSCTKMCEEM